MTVLSVVIVNWNTGPLLSECLESLYADLPLGRVAPADKTDRPLRLHAEDVEVFVVDNCSSDGSARAAAERFPQVRLIENAANPGFAAANNQALRLACGQYALLLNPDTVLRPGALDGLVDFLERNPRAGAVGPRLLNPDGSLQYSCSPEPTLRGEFLRLFHIGGVRTDGYYAMERWEAQPRAVDTLLGACILARRAALEQVGYFDTGYFMYTEEVDLCRKLRQAGWGVHWTPAAEVAHYGGQSTRLAAAEMFLQLYQSKLAYFRKYGGRGAGWVYKLILLGASLVRVATAAATRQPAQAEIARNYRRLIASLASM
jgi:GT2 family glycosyltransferase